MLSKQYPALQHRPYRLLWSGLLVSNMGTWMQNVAQSWLIYKMTDNDPRYLGWLGLTFAIPMIVLPPLGGFLADRFPRPKILTITQWSMMAVALIQALLTWSNLNSPALILVATFVGAVLLAVDNPTRQALIPTLVPRHDLMNALALNSATYNGAALIGPALAGFLLGIMGPGWLFLGNAVSYLAVIYAVTQMPFEAEQGASTMSLREALLGGVTYAWVHALTGVLLITSTIMSIFGRSYQQLLPVYADDIWRISAQGYGILLSAAGAGAMIGALGLASIPAITPNQRNLRIAGMGFALTLAGFAVAPWWWLGVIMLVLVGIIGTAATTMIATMLQLSVPAHLRGRVMSLHAVTLIGVPSLGGLLITNMTTWLGRGETLSNINASGAPLALISGAICVLMLFLVLRLPADHGAQSPS
ncbi:MAG: MFS transporter [Chloroflexota bacterium]|jgi:MFS family permease